MKTLDRSDLVQLGGGLPDPALFPHDRMREACEAIFRDPVRARQALQYAPSEGVAGLRNWIADRMAGLGAPCKADNVLVTNGSQQALDFIGRLFLSAGDRLLIESPAYIGALRAFDAYEARYGALPLPGVGEADGAAARFGYVGSDFQNPRGTCLTLAEREALLEAMDARHLPLVEDGCYEGLRYDGEPLPSLLAMAVARTGSVEAAGVLYTGSFSKTLAPSLRIGWIVGPSAVIRKLTLIKQASDLASGALNQMLALYLAETCLEEQTKRACAVYRGRRNAALEALGHFMPASVRWTRPEGGLYIWLELPAGLDGGEVAMRGLSEAGVSVVPGAAFYPQQPERNTLRLSYSLETEDRVSEGVRRLAALLDPMLAAQSAAETAISSA